MHRLKSLPPSEKAVPAAPHRLRRRRVADHSVRSAHRALVRAPLVHAVDPALLLRRSPAFAKHCILCRIADRTRWRSALCDSASASPLQALPPEPALTIWSVLAPAVRVLWLPEIPDSVWEPSIRISERGALRSSGTLCRFPVDRK